jgi:hypothetical protein
VAQPLLDVLERRIDVHEGVERNFLGSGGT